MPLRRILLLTPWPVRRRVMFWVVPRVLTRLPQRRQLRTACRVAPLDVRSRSGKAEKLRVRTPHGRLTARRVVAATPAAVRQGNLNRVIQALDNAGVSWFRVPVEALTSTAVAVREEDRGRVLALLKALDAARLEVVRLGRRSTRVTKRTAGVLRISWPVTDSNGNLVLGPEFGCEIEFWRTVDGSLTGPRSNPVADVVALDEPLVEAPEPVFGGFCDPADTTPYRTPAVFTMVSPDRVAFPIDVVYTWVDGGDPAWRERKARALRENGWVGEANVMAANNSRYTSRDELRYSLRALHAFAPWVRHIFLVTADQVPAWLDTSAPGLTVVSHHEVFGDTGRLPTFNSQAIESRLHRIPGLAEHFLYLNDDVFLGKPVPPELFFTPGGLTRFFPSTALIDSAPRRTDEPPVNSAGKNNRRLIQEAFGRVLTRKMKHTPHPSRRSVLAEMELRFAEHVEATAEHQFRHPEDISMLSSLQQYYAYLTGRAAPNPIDYMYTDLSDVRTPFRLAQLLHDRRPDAFCLNDTDSDPAEADEQAELLARFLPAYLPFASPFELAVPRAATTPISPSRTPVVARQQSRATGDGPIHPDIALPSPAESSEVA
ncbi:hypothetical protein HH310_15325 [Actinoplanes sp. TBRC 11911]|uniref:stealth family protein n=1 Tax=Actinoplanes sp. TBRC 11911 TaxID=2729386 RepID=UPI00145D21D9|nr:stealth family protein [Actinoplanes sp. TBRC 11911]NMO52559.1 hypothetical protein [Actinoplanes sp. TBRC 11911]